MMRTSVLLLLLFGCEAQDSFLVASQRGNSLQGNRASTSNNPSCNLHVSVVGNDSGTGESHAPLASVHEAARRLKALASSHSSMVTEDLYTICLGSGVHRLGAVPFALNSSHNLPGRRVEWKGEPDGSSIISGGAELTKWYRCGDGVHCDFPDYNGVWVHMVSDIPNVTAADFPFRQLWVNGLRMQRALLNTDTIGGTWTATATGYTTSAKIAGVANWVANQVEFRWPSQVKNWIEPRCVVSEVDGPGTSAGLTGHNITVAPECFAALRSRNGGKSPAAPTLIENVAMGGPSAGEFFASPLYVFYRPLASTPYLEPKDAYVPVTSVIVDADGLSDHTFESVSFQHATWRIPTMVGGYVPSQSCVTPNFGEPVGAVRFSRTVGLTIKNCTFQQIGAAYALSIGYASKNITVIESTFSGLAGGAVKLGNVNDTRAVLTNPAEFDDVYVFEDNTIVDTALEFRGAATVFAGYVANTRIAHNSISNTGYTGISLGWGWGTHVKGPQTWATDNHILSNRLSNVMSALNDGGCTYTLGPQPRSSVEGNYCESDHARVVGFFYHDNGSRYFLTRNNVAKGGPAPCVYLQGCCNSPAYDILVTNLWCQATAPVQNGCQAENCTIDPTTLHIVPAKSTLPADAQAIMNAAGVRKEFSELVFL